MNLFKSRQVNLDPEPVIAPGGERFDGSGWMPLPNDGYNYAPRPEFEPTRDHAPWAERGNHNVRSATHFKGSEWAPRREQFDTPVNRVLVRYRESQTMMNADTLENWLWFLERQPYTPDEIEHARTVLTRLAGWSA